MCNAWNHFEGCECGFGPPYPGRVTFGQRHSWYDVALSNSAELERGLKESGIKPRAVGDTRRRYRSAGYPVADEKWVRLSQRQRESLLAKLKNLLGLENEKVLERTTKWHKIHLFRLHSPECAASRVSYREAVRKGRAKGWHLTIPGIGRGATQEVTVEFSAEFDSREGECTLIFVQIPFMVLRIGVFERGRLVREHLRVAVQRDRVERITRKASMDRPKAECLGLADRHAACIGSFPLSGEKATKIVRYKHSWISEKKSVFGFRLAAFGLAVDAEAHIRCFQKVGLTYELPGGHNYSVFSAGKSEGIVWKTYN